MAKRKPSPVSPDAWLTLSVVCIVSMLMSLNMNTLNIALPIIVRHFDASPAEGSWLLLAYMVTSSALLVPFGRLTDMVGQRKIYLWGLSVFTLTSFLCGLAPNVHVLIALRAIQAASSAVMLTNGATLIHEAFPASRLTQAMGFYTASFSVAALAGPTVGGFIAEYGGWRWVFWFNVPLCILGLIWGILKLTGRERPDDRLSLDASGNSVLLVILVMLTFSISQVSELGLTNPMVLTPFIIAILLVPLLLFVERRARHPVLSADVLKSNGVAHIYAAGFLTGASRFPIVVVMGIYFQSVLGYSAGVSGAMLLPTPIGMIMTSMILGNLAERRDPRRLATIGSIIGLFGTLLVLLGALLSSAWIVMAGMGITGAGTGVFMGSNTSALLANLPENKVGVGNAIRLMVQNVGNVLSVAIVLALLTGTLPEDQRSAVLSATADTSSGVATALIPGFVAGMVFLGVLSILGVLSCVLGERDQARRAAQDLIYAAEDSEIGAKPSSRQA